MDYIYLNDLYGKEKEYEGKKIKLKGWIRNHRKQKDFGFIQFSDGTCFKQLQLVYDHQLKNFEEVQKFHICSAIEVEGELITSSGQGQDYELKVSDIVLHGDCPEDYPIQPKRHSMEFLREQSYLRLRTNTFQAVFRVRSVASMAIHQFFQERGFVYTHTPLITGSDCEGAGEMFRVTTLDLNNVPKTEEGAIDFKQDFFGKESNLTVSGQLNAECYALAFRNVYTFGPTFRAENSNTARHAAEFWMIEPEIAFADLQDDMELAEDMLKYVLEYVLAECPEEMAFFNQFIDKGILDRLNHVVSSDFGRG